MDIKKELWNGMGYVQLGLKSQNLRDQAARLEKMISNETAETVQRYAPVDAVLWTTRTDCTTQYFAENESLNNQDVEREYVNSTVIDLDLHMTGNEKAVEERKDTIDNSSQVLNDVPGCLPEYTEISRPHTVDWNRNSDVEIITISSSLIDGAYNEITTWRKKHLLGPLWENRTRLHRPVKQAYQRLEQWFGHATSCFKSRHCSFSHGATKTKPEVES